MVVGNPHKGKFSPKKQINSKKVSFLKKLQRDGIIKKVCGKVLPRNMRCR